MYHAIKGSTKSSPPLKELNTGVMLGGIVAPGGNLSGECEPTKFVLTLHAYGGASHQLHDGLLTLSRRWC